MAKPSWITIVSGSTGSGSGTRSLKASSHTGRSSRSGSIKGVTSGGATDSVVLSQNGAVEFITVDKTSYSVTALGGTVKITGTSNSPSLKFYQLSNPSSLSNFALKVNGTAYTWNGSSSHTISGDPGASASYTFEISFDVVENQTESSRSIIFNLSDSGYSPLSSKITIKQDAGVKTYGQGSINFRYPTWRINAAGGSTSPKTACSVPWGWNGKTSGGGTLDIIDADSISYAYRNGGPSSPHSWTLDQSTGHLTMTSLGKNITTGSGNIYIEVTIVIAGQTLTEFDYVRQDANKATYKLNSASVTLSDIPASGGSADSPNFVSASGNIDYTSGESDTPSIASSDVTITLSKTVNGSNLGSTVKARTKLDTVTATITWNGSSVTQSLDIYQQANQATYSSVNVVSSTVIVPKTGGDVDIAAKVHPNQTATYTSGATIAITDFTYEFTSVLSWVTVDELTLKATVEKNITGSTRNEDIKIKVTGEGNKSTTASLSLRQESSVIPSWNAPSTYRFDSIGQSDYSPGGLDLEITDSDSVGWTIDGPSYVTEGSTENSSLPISGTGNKSISLTPGNNTSTSDRTFTLTLKASDGTVIATCECTQDASEPSVTWDLPETQAFEGGGDGVIFKITDSNNVGWRLTFPDWCDVSDGKTFGVGDHDTDLVARVNETGSRRSGTVRLISTDGNTVYATCTVTQDSFGEITLNPNSIDIEPEQSGDISVNYKDITPSSIGINKSDSLKEAEENSWIYLEFTKPSGDDLASGSFNLNIQVTSEAEANHQYSFRVYGIGGDGNLHTAQGTIVISGYD